MFKTALFALVFLLCCFGMFEGVAHAAAALDPNASDPSFDIAKLIFQAITGHQYAYAGALGLALGVAVVKRWGGNWLPQKQKDGTTIGWFHTDVGGTVLTLAGAWSTALVAGLAGGGHVSLAMMKASFGVALTAAGGYAVLKKLVVGPLLKPLAKKAPAWMQPLFAMVFWMFDKPDPISQAEAAGEQAVKDQPAQGVEGVVGKPTEIE